MLNVILYTYEGCEACDEVRHELQRLQAEYPHRLYEVDVTHQDAFHNHRARLPMIEIGHYHLEAPFSLEALQITLRAAWEQAQKAGSKPFSPPEVSRADRILFSFTRHYVLVLNLILALYVGVPFLAPLFMKAGLTLPARMIYAFYAPFCHQLAFRSWFLFGEQAYYPLEAARIPGVKTFEAISGLRQVSDPWSPERLQARAFVGNEQVGYKVALCERDVAIYGSMLLFGLLFARFRNRLRPLPLLWWVVLGLLPIGLDGFSQLFSQYSFAWLSSFLPYRESTPFLRTLTGFLFGFLTAWVIFPALEPSMQETERLFLRKFALSGK
jgi:uncharacterized membrane protein